MTLKADYRPVVFIGSASEDLETAHAIGALLDHQCQVKPWTSLGSPGSFFLRELIEKVGTSDFAILIADAVDITQSRHTEGATPRDNVVFELGLCQGVIGVDRCFLLYDRTRPPRLPSDLLGLTAATYQGHVDGNLFDALQAPVHRILTTVRRLGPRVRGVSPPSPSFPFVGRRCTIVDRWNGLALDSQKPLDAPEHPVLWTPHSLPWQQWWLHQAEDATVVIESVHRRLVLTTDDEPLNRSPIWLATDKGHRGQRWVIDRLEDGFAFQIRLPASLGQALDSDYDALIPAASEGHTVGQPTRPIMYENWTGECQQWSISALQ